MTADRLREAARVLREDSEAASRSDAEGPWTWRVTGDKKWAVVMDADGSWMAQVDDDDRAAYIATMHPGVGLALVDVLRLLDSTGLGDDRAVVALVDKILGGAR